MSSCRSGAGVLPVGNFRMPAFIIIGWLKDILKYETKKR